MSISRKPTTSTAVKLFVAQNKNEQTPHKEDLSQQENNNIKSDKLNMQVPYPLKNIPTPFKKAFFWPEAYTSAS